MVEQQVFLGGGNEAAKNKNKESTWIMSLNFLLTYLIINCKYLLFNSKKTNAAVWYQSVVNQIHLHLWIPICII